jgi:hypothetical protein
VTSRTNPRIDAQREILRQVLSLQPKTTDFDAQVIAEWQKIGMGPTFYLYNGIESFARVVEEQLDRLDAEEKEWRKKKSE